jgi:quercetin dioxygenase-like cupin family protein
MQMISSSQPVTLTSDEIAKLPVSPLGGMAGITHRVLWQTDTSMAGVLTVEKGHSLGAHTHRENHHHLWVLDGHAKILGSDVGPGSYVHVPSGVEHDIDATTTDGCTVYYLYLRVSPS